MARALKVGDRVKVVKSVWDPAREKDWEGSEGTVVSIAASVYIGNVKPFPVFVHFEVDDTFYSNYDFKHEELQIV